MYKEKLMKGKASSMKYDLKKRNVGRNECFSVVLKNSRFEELKQEKGITLIALVITVIVLLILAGVAIASLSGENGILTRAGQASDNTKRASIVEQAQLAVLNAEVQANGKTLTGTDIKRVLADSNLFESNSVETIDATKMSDGKYLKDTKLTSSDGKFKDIALSEILGSVTTTATNTQSDAYLALSEGDEVYYAVEGGDPVKCYVLYDSTSSYGVQIITANTVGTVTLGSDSDIDKARTDYNGAIGILNGEAETYRNNNANLKSLTTGARCVGSVPNAKDTRNSTKVNSGYDILADYETEQRFFEQGEEYYEADGYSGNNRFIIENPNYTADYNKMTNLPNSLNISSSDKEYWLASRNSAAGPDFADFGVLLVDANGDNLCALCQVEPNEAPLPYSYEYGIRPVFTLNTNIKTTTSNGKTMLSLN